MPPESLSYPSAEHEALQEINTLHGDWKRAHVEALRDLPEDPASLYVTDGFFPHYFDQKVRILFVGRESRGLSEHDYIDALWKAYVHDRKIGNLSLNSSKIHRLLFYVTYALNRKCFGYADIPYATELAGDFGQVGGLSWAMMNLSKLSNDTEDWSTQWNLVDQSLQASNGRPFHREMVRILKPHVIITMNLSPYLKLISDVESLEKDTDIYAYSARYEGGTALLLDMHHFSATSKADERCFIEPLSRVAAPLLPQFCPGW